MVKNKKEYYAIYTKKLRLKLRANVMEQKIFEIENLKELEEFLKEVAFAEHLPAHIHCHS